MATLNLDRLFDPRALAGTRKEALKLADEIGYPLVMKDVSFRLCPVTQSEAMAMIREIRAFPILDGARGKPRADLDALAAAIMRLSALAIDLKDEVAELDINPLFVFPAGRGVKAGDALIKPRTTHG